MTTTPMISNQNMDSNGTVSTKRISSPKSVCVTDGQCQQSFVLKNSMLMVKRNACTSSAIDHLLDLLSTHPDMITQVSLVNALSADSLEASLGPLRELSFMLREFPLQELDCTNCYLGEKGLEAAGSLFLGKQLQRLYVGNCGLNTEATFLMVEYLLEICAPPLRSFTFERNPCGDEGAEALGRLVSFSHNLHMLKLSEVSRTAEGMLPIVQAISSIASLQSLDLSNNIFTKDVVRRLAESLKHHSELEYLSLKNCGITDKGLIVFLAILSEVSFPRLAYLDLSGNKLNHSEIWPDLHSWVQTNTTNMQYLALDHSVDLHGKRCYTI